MSLYDTHYYYFNKITLCMVGQWPFQSRLKNNVMFAVAAILIFSLTAFEFWGLVAGITDLNIIMENLSPFLINSYIIMKLMNSFFNNSKMKQLLEDIEETWKVKHAGPENEILRHYAEESRIMTLRYGVLIYMTWFLYCSPPIIISGIHALLPTNETYSGTFIYRFDHVVDMDKYYNLLMFHGFISAFILVTAMIAVDTFFTVCTQHVCALFRCIKYNIEQIQGKKIVLLNPNIEDDEAYHSIISCIKSYKHAIKFSELLSSTYAIVFLFVLGNIVLSTSFGVAELAMLDVPLDELIRILAADTAQIIHIYYLSVQAQQLIDYSNELQVVMYAFLLAINTTVFYSCDWYKISLRSRHLLRFTLLRATKLCQIRAGNMFVMSMETFTGILKMTMSYYTMLTSLK